MDPRSASFAATCTLLVLLSPIVPAFAETVSMANNPACHRIGSVPLRSCETWTARYDGPGQWYEKPEDVLASPDGSLVHLVASSVGDDTARDVAVLTYDAASGDHVWTYRYDGNGAYDVPSQAVVGENGTIYVAASSDNAAGDEDYLVLALNGSTGEKRWIHRFDGPANDSDVLHFHDIAEAIAIDPSGDRVFVTGTLRTTQASFDVGTIALDADNGQLLWQRRLDGGENGSGETIAVSPDGSTVYVTASVAGGQTVTAYDAETGSTRWISPDTNQPGQITVGRVIAHPDGDRIVVASSRQNAEANVGLRFRLRVLNADNGTPIWTRKGPPGKVGDVALGPKGESLYVSGTTTSVDEGAIVTDIAVLSLDVDTGTRDWLTVYQGPYELDVAGELAVGIHGSMVYVSGSSASLTLRDVDAVTLGFETGQGELTWGVRFASKNFNYNHGFPQDSGGTVTLSPDGKKLYSGILSDNLSGNWDAVTLSYRTP